jgi:CubicO group peptidase (beta-lactamase class C family)
MRTPRPWRPLAVALAAAAVVIPAAPASAGWAPKLRLPESATAKLQRDLQRSGQNLQRELQPLADTRAAWASYVSPGRAVPGAPPPGSLGASPRQIAASNVVGDPAYWQAWWERLTGTQGWQAGLPWPADLIKPELFLPISAVPKGGAAWELEREPRDITGVSYTYKGRTRTVARYLRTTETDGLLFLHRGRLVSEDYGNGYGATQPHQPWSITKSFVSALVGIAVGEGRIVSLGDPIERYIPEIARSAWAGTTIRNLLEMESGMEWDETNLDLTKNTQVLQWRDMWTDYVSGGRAGRDRNEYLMTLRRIAPQGTTFHYSSANTQVLAWLLESVYGRSFVDVLSEKLWKPMGMEADASILTDRRGRAIASMGLYSVARDLARFGQLFLNGGRTPDGRQLVPEAWVRESTDLRGPENTSNGEYAYQWWANGADPAGYLAWGFQGNFIAVSPSACTVAVRLAHTLGLSEAPPGAEGPIEIEEGKGEFDAMLAAVNAELGGCPAGG